MKSLFTTVLGVYIYRQYCSHGERDMKRLREDVLFISQPASLDDRLTFSGNTVLTDSFLTDVPPSTTSDVCMSIDSGLVVIA